MNKFKELKVWQEEIEFISYVYRVTGKLIEKETFNKLNTRIVNVQKKIYGLQKALLKTKD